MLHLGQYIKSWTEENQPLGKALGYPDCCIAAFCSQPPELLNHTGPSADDRLRLKAAYVNGKYTGFIPCTEHAVQILSGKITLASLVQKREPQFPPFPKFGAHDE